MTQANLTLRTLTPIEGTTKGSALTFEELDQNLKNLANVEVSSDTTPQLGGDLDVNGQSIVSASAGNITISPDTTGSIVLDGLAWPQADGTANQVIVTNGTGQLSFTDQLADLVDDTTPQLGGNLDVNGNWITGDAKFDTSLTLDNNQDAVTLISVKNTDTNANAAAEIRFTSGADAFDFGFMQRAGDGYAQTYFTAVDPEDLAIGNFFGDIRFCLGGEFIATAGNFIVGTQSTDRLTVNSVSGNVTVHTGDVVMSSGKGVDFNTGTPFTGTFATLSNKDVTDYKETVYTGLGTTGTISPDPNNGSVQAITLTGSITLSSLTNAVAGQTVTVIITQPASGGPYTLTSTMKFAGGEKTLSTAADAIDIMTIFYDGTNYFASLAKGFA